MFLLAVAAGVQKGLVVVHDYAYFNRNLSSVSLLRSAATSSGVRPPVVCGRHVGTPEIEEHRGRLAGLLRRVNPSGHAVQHGAPLVVRGAGIGSGFEQQLLHLTLVGSGAVRAEEAHERRASFQIASVHLHLSFNQTLQNPHCQRVVVVLAGECQCPLAGLVLPGIGVPSVGFEELHERGETLHTVGDAAPLLDQDGKGRRPFRGPDVGVGARPEQHGRGLGLPPSEGAHERRLPLEVVHLRVGALLLQIDSRLQQGSECLHVALPQRLEDIHASGLHRRLVERVLPRQQGAHPFGPRLRRRWQRASCRSCSSPRGRMRRCRAAGPAVM